MTSRPEEFGPSWDHLYFGGPYYYGERVLFGSDKVPLERIVTAVEPFTPILFVDAVELRSPGFLQVIGKLNPLTAITKFISRWRAENTKRLDIAVNADLERERLRTEGALERDRIRSDFALGVIGSIPPSQRPIAAERLSEIIDYVINPTTTALQTLATDPRIIDAEVVSPGTPLPAKKRKKRRR
jgi:hypothetical protein